MNKLWKAAAALFAAVWIGVPAPVFAAEGGTEILTENAAGSAYEQKLIRTVNLSLETMEFDSLIDRLKEKTEAAGGYTESSEISISAGTEDTHQAFLVLRAGMDFRIRCKGCGREVMVPRLKIEKNIRKIMRDGKQVMPPLQES